MKTTIILLFALFSLLPGCKAQEAELSGDYHGYRKGASYELHCTAHENGLYTLSGMISYSSDGRGYRPGDTHCNYGGRRKENSIRFTGYSYGNPQIEDIPSPRESAPKCELYYEKTTGKYYFIDYRPYGEPYEIMYIVEMTKSDKKS